MSRAWKLPKFEICAPIKLEICLGFLTNTARLGIHHNSEPHAKSGALSKESQTLSFKNECNQNRNGFCMSLKSDFHSPFRWPPSTSFNKLVKYANDTSLPVLISLEDEYQNLLHWSTVNRLFTYVSNYCFFIIGGQHRWAYAPLAACHCILLCLMLCYCLTWQINSLSLTDKTKEIVIRRPGARNFITPAHLSEIEQITSTKLL